MNRSTKTPEGRSLRQWSSFTAARYKDISAERDENALAATLTFYGAISVVPLLLLALRACALLTSPDWVIARGADVATLLPDALGARAVVHDLVGAGAGLTVLHCLLAVFPATFYGEGIRRSLTARRPRRRSFEGWRGRLALVPVALAASVLLLGFLAAAGWLADATTGGGVAALVVRVFLGFNVVFLMLCVLVGGAFALVAAEPLPIRVVLWCSAATASILAGFLQGFVLFLAIPVSLGAPFGGLTAVGAVVAIGLWMWVLHVILIAGWTFTQACARARRLRPTSAGGPPPSVEPVRGPRLPHRPPRR